MSILLSNAQIEILRGLQKNLDIRVRNENGIALEEDLGLEKYLALKTEFFEFVNEVESFKYWKKNKGKDSILEEACDTLHFVLSLAIDNDVEIKDLELHEGYNADDYNMNELMGIMDAIISDCYIEQEWDSLEAFLTLLHVALDKCGYNADDLYDAYIKKNRENHERQDNKY